MQEVIAFELQLTNSQVFLAKLVLEPHEFTLVVDALLALAVELGLQLLSDLFELYALSLEDVLELSEVVVQAHLPEVEVRAGAAAGRREAADGGLLLWLSGDVAVV